MQALRVLVGLGVVVFACQTVAVMAAELPPAATTEVDFARDVYPLLKSRCLDCHAGSEAESGVRLDARRELLGETNGRPVVVVGRSAESRLIQLVAGHDKQLFMPPKESSPPLAATQIGILRAWIDQGLKWDEQVLPAPSARSAHWAFQPVRRPSLPDVARRDWPTTAIDVFVAVAQEQRQLTAAAPAAHQQRLRRLALDLTGLPPDFDQANEFLQDLASGVPDAWSRVVDRWLASPAYGQRWGRHWLDVARWAESEGYESNHPRLYAWRYRDYVVRAFNRDLPFDQFLREQIAGDELAEGTDEQLIATGFLAGARLSSNEEDKTLQRSAVLVDIVNLVGEGVLGLTLACAQCHNHKFDPLTQRDYYRLQSFFVSGQPGNLVLSDPAGWHKYQAAKPADYDQAVRLREAMESRVRAQLLAERRQNLDPAAREALDKPLAQRTPAEHELARQAELKLQITNGQIERQFNENDRRLYDSLKKMITTYESAMPDRPQTWGFYSPRTASRTVDVLPMKGFYPLPFEPAALREAQTFLLVRGDPHRRGPLLDPGVPEVLDAATSPAPRATSLATRTTSFATRSQLVDWLVSPDQPLTARVWANRVWQYHLGRGIVATSGDFGVKGAPPSHPELLDFLADELRVQGWSTKQLHRAIVLSNTYQQTSEVSDEQRERDPTNQWWTRWQPRRLESEAIRDALLDVSGLLDHAADGPSAAEPRSRRRTVYLQHLRDRPPEIQRLFDAPSANESCARRHVSTVALQPLFLLNHELSVTAARALADRVEAASADDERRIEWAFRWTLGRAPDAKELAAVRNYLREPAAVELATAAPQTQPLSRWTLFCQTLLNLNEFHYIE